MDTPSEDEAEEKAKRAKAARELIKSMGVTDPNVSLAPAKPTKAEEPRPAQAAPDRSKLKPNKRRVFAALGVVASLGLLGALLVYQKLGSDQYDISYVTGLELGSARRDGKRVRAQIRDQRWATLAEEQRRMAVKAVWSQVRGAGMEALALLDQEDQPVAMASDEIPEEGVLLIRTKGQ